MFKMSERKQTCLGQFGVMNQMMTNVNDDNSAGALTGVNVTAGNNRVVFKVNHVYDCTCVQVFVFTYTLEHWPPPHCFPAL